MNRERKNIGILLFIVLFVTTAFGLTENDYKKGLELSTKFFGANRCGDTANSWIGHDRCHWFDGDDNGVDLSGGWHDCGDHPKFGQTGGYAATVLLHGYVTFPGAYEDKYSPRNSSGAPNGIPDVLDEAKYYTDYALKLLQGDDFYYQVGTAASDHMSCSTPKYQSESEPSKGGVNSRPSFKKTGGGASNIAGIHSAALSLMYLAYKPFDETYANKCKDMAIKLYDFGNKKHEAVSSTGGSAPYTDTTWADDMALAAALLFRVTANSDYKLATLEFMRSPNYNLLPTYFVLDYPMVSPLVQYELGKNLFTKTSYKTPLATEARIHADSMIQHGFAFFGYEDSSWGSMKYAAAASYVSMLAYDLFPDSAQFKQFAVDNVDFMMGDHGYISSDIGAGFSFLVGFGSSYPDGHVHHAAAFGRAPGVFGSSSGMWGSWSTDNNHTLMGALVGGPTTKDGGYENYRNNPYTNEVCIYYNAPLVSTLAAIIGGNDPDPKAPTNITLSSSTVYSDKADATVGSITVTDPNAGDTHTLTLVSGGDKFKISGTSLVTTVALPIGSETIKIKATDQTNLSYEKEFTITVKAEPVGDENVCAWLGWYVYIDEFGSKVDTGSGLLVSDSIATATFTMVKDDAANNKYVAGGMGSKLASATGKTYLAGSEYIIIEYKATEAFNFVVPSKGIDPNSGASYYTELNPASSWKIDTLKLDETEFSQPSWVETKTAFDLSTSDGFDITPAFQEKAGKIEVRTIKIQGMVHGDVPVAKDFVQSAGQFKVNSVDSRELNLTVPAEGYYTIQAYALNGRKLGSFTKRLNTGSNILPWQDAAYFGSNMIIFHVMGNGTTFTQKLVLK